MNFLKKINVPSNRSFSVKDELHRRIPGYDTLRSLDTLHASDLSSEDFCPRERVFNIMGATFRPKRFIGTSMRMTFDHGRAIENRIRNIYLRDLLVGDWYCDVCNSSGITGHYPKYKCFCCGYSRWSYRELRVGDKSCSGGLDGLIKDGNSYRILELKTMDKDQFKTLNAPLPEHRLRSCLYMYLAEQPTQFGLDIDIITNSAIVLYVSKSFGISDKTLKERGIEDEPFSPFKEFYVDRDDHIIQPRLKMARAVKRFRDSEGKEIPSGVCSSPMDKRAAKCSSCQLCFSDKYKATFDWRET